MERPRDLTDSLKGLIDTGRLLATLTGNDDQRVPAFWVRSMEEMSKAITQKTINEYNNKDHPKNANYPDKICPHNIRFPGIQKQFRDIFDAEEDELNKDFIQKYVDDSGRNRVKINTDWIKIERDLENDGHGKEDEKLEQSIRENAGYRITAVKYSPEERKMGKVDIELGLSDFFRAALWVDIKRKGMSPRFPYLVMWYIHHCFLFSLGDDCPSTIKDGIEIMWERRETLLEKPKNKMDVISDDVKNSIAPFINGNKEHFTAFTNQIAANRPQMTDQNVDQIVEECDKALELFTSNGNMDLPQMIAKLMSADETKVRETMTNFGLSEKRIHSVIEGATAGLSNDELKASIPGKEEKDLSHLLSIK